MSVIDLDAPYQPERELEFGLVVFDGTSICHSRYVEMADQPIRHWLTKLGVWTAHPGAFLMVPIYGALWFHFDRETFNWHAVAVLATWFMTLVIQRAEYRDTQAVHAKLDELLHVEHAARNSLTNIDKKDPEDIEKHRKVERAMD